MGAVAQQFMTLGAAVVQEVAKLKLRPRNSVRSAHVNLTAAIPQCSLVCTKEVVSLLASIKTQHCNRTAAML